MPAPLRRRRVIFDGRSPRRLSAPVYDRALLRPGNAFTGPAVIVEYSATTVLPPGCRARVDRFTNIVLEVGRG